MQSLAFSFGTETLFVEPIGSISPLLVQGLKSVKFLLTVFSLFFSACAEDLSVSLQLENRSLIC